MTDTAIVPPASRTCDCPCHRGADVFHIVSCCGSVLGRRPPRPSREQEAALASAQAASRAGANDGRRAS